VFSTEKNGLLLTGREARQESGEIFHSQTRKKEGVRVWTDETLIVQERHIRPYSLQRKHCEKGTLTTRNAKGLFNAVKLTFERKERKKTRDVLKYKDKEGEKLE